MPEIIVENRALISKENEGRDKYRGVIFQPHGIAKKFLQLSTENEILDFSNKYGMLGCKLVKNSMIFDSFKEYFDSFEYHPSNFEQISAWEWHKNHIKNLFNL